MRPTGVFFLPGTVTQFEGVRQVSPNCLLRADLSAPGQESHDRFWPTEPRVESPDVEGVSAEFRDRMREHIRLISRFGPVAWSLTGGLDSRGTLATAADSLPAGTVAFTYFNPRDGVRLPEAAQDVFDANQIAYQMGVPHRVLRWRQAPRDHVFARIHSATHPVSYSSHGAGFAMWADLPHDIVEMQSIGGEIGTVFGRRRSPTPLTPEKMSALWMGDGFEGRDPYTALFAEYLEYAQLTDERLHGYDHHDVVYWELRLGKWGFTKYLLGDYSHRTMLPFNDRRLIETMHRMPEKDRLSKTLYQSILATEPRACLPEPR
ncbi:hypothetical protein BJF81_08485 [Ornithinimicrobium sp. CNJ-824]|nr:hypothetical protein BJF81_08485 [Ornithinimicrobium sp. CNJ-824]